MGNIVGAIISKPLQSDDICDHFIKQRCAENENIRQFHNEWHINDVVIFLSHFGELPLHI